MNQALQRQPRISTSDIDVTAAQPAGGAGPDRSRTMQATDPAFFAELAANAVLHSSILRQAVTGDEAVRGAVRRIAACYSSMQKGVNSSVGKRQLMQYHARIGDGVAIHAIVVMTRNAEDAIENIEIGYYPLEAARLLATLYQEQS